MLGVDVFCTLPRLSFKFGFEPVEPMNETRKTKLNSLFFKKFVNSPAPNDPVGFKTEPKSNFNVGYTKKFSKNIINKNKKNSKNV